jgi:hypothetical protein
VSIKYERDKGVKVDGLAFVFGCLPWIIAAVICSLAGATWLTIAVIRAVWPR